MKPTNVHSPRPTGRSLDREPLCNSAAAAPIVAKPGDVITCQTCLAHLQKKAQLLNYLLERGYKMGPVHVNERKGRKKDPRQMEFGDDR